MFPLALGMVASVAMAENDHWGGRPSEKSMSTADETTSESSKHDHDHDHDHTLDLQVEIRDAGPCLKHVRIVIPRKDIEHAFEHALDNMSDTVAIPGFRTGHAPKGLVQKRFRDEIKDQVRQQLLVESLEQVAEDHDLDPINEPDLDVKALEIPDEGDFEYEFDVEVRPSFDVPDYTGLKIERPKVEVAPEEVEAYMQRYLAPYGTLVPEEGPAKLGDTITLSAKFTRTENSEVLHEIDEFSARLAPVLRFRDAELENFGELFEGATIGTTKETEVMVSGEAESIELRGVTVKVDFELLDIKRPEMPEMNAAFFERLGVESLEELRERIEEMLKRQAVYRERQNARSQVLTKITESADWELPESLVSRQVENALRREILEMQQAGFTQSDIRAHENRLRQNAITTTRQALKEHFVLDRIAEQEDIEVPESDLQQEIMLMAMQQGESPRRLRSRLVKSGMIENLMAQLRERKAIDFILSKAEFTDVPAPESEPIDRVTAVSQSVCGSTVPSTVADDAGEEEETEE